MPLPLGLIYNNYDITCLTVMHLLLPEIGINDLKKTFNLSRWNGVLYFPKHSIDELRKGDIILFRYCNQPQHVSIVLSRDGGRLFELWDYMSLINYRNMNFSYRHYLCEVYRPSRIIVE